MIANLVCGSKIYSNLILVKYLLSLIIFWYHIILYLNI